MKIVKQTILETANESGYPVYRIPGIVCLENGFLAVCYECRLGSDWSVIDVGFRLSKDSGLSWTERKVIVSSKGRNAVNNPTLIANGTEIILLYCENYKRMFCTKSRDFGENWSDPVEITNIFDEYYWSCVAVGPGHGIVLQNGILLTSVWLAFNQNDMFSHHPSACATIYSDDNGVTWRCGDLIKGILQDPSEACLNECTDGSVIINIRNENEEKCRAICKSRNGYTDWTAPAFQTNLPDPTCFAGMCKYNEGCLFVNCCDRNDRTNLTLKQLSCNNIIADSLLVDPAGGYADVCYNKNTGTSFVFYETQNGRYLKIAEIKN